MAVSSIDLPKASRVSIAGVAHVNDLGGIIDFFCVNQSEAPYTLVLVMRAWVLSGYHCGTPGAVSIAYLMISPGSSEAEFHFNHVNMGFPVCL